MFPQLHIFSTVVRANLNCFSTLAMACGNKRVFLNNWEKKKRLEFAKKHLALPSNGTIFTDAVLFK